MTVSSRDGTSCNLRSSTSVSHQRDALACVSWDRGYETLYTSSDFHPRIFLKIPNLLLYRLLPIAGNPPCTVVLLPCMLLENSMVFVGILLSSLSQHLSFKTAHPFHRRTTIFSSSSNMSTVEDIATAPPESAPDEKSADFRVYRPPQASANESSPGSSRTYHRQSFGDEDLPAPPGELPESFFVPSAADLKAAQDSLSVRTHTLMNAPLRTQAMRDADTKIKMQKYPTVRDRRLCMHTVCSRTLVDDYQSEVHRSHTVGEDFPFDRQDPLCICLCPQFTPRGREAD